MKKNVIIILISISYILCYSACSNIDAPWDSNQRRQNELFFNSSIESDLITRVKNNSWEKGDKIGVYAWSTGESLSPVTVNPEIYNRAFVSNGSNQFSVLPGTNSVEYPSIDNPLDFIAYYPYSENKVLEDFILPINLLDNLDVLFANNLKEVGNPSKKANLVFKHQLSKIRIRFISSDLDLKGAKVVLKNIPTEADFNIVKGTLLTKSLKQDLVANTSFNNNSLEATALIIPDSGIGVITIAITLENGQVFVWKTPSNWKWSSNMVYTKTLELRTDNAIDPVEPILKVPYFEYPSLDNITARQMVVMHMDPENSLQRSFTMLYDKDMLFAYWIAFPHHKYYTKGSAGGRNEDWKNDPKIDSKYQPQLSSSYVGGYSRGHQVASSDRQRSKAMNRQTYYFSNMTPQVQSFNGGIWLNLEKAIQNLVNSTNDTIYVVTGAGVYDKSTMKMAKTKSGQNTPVPDYYYKLMARKIDGNYKTIAYFLNHFGSTGNFTDYKKTVKEVEKITGFTFYPNLPDPKVKEVIAEEIWKK